jgi:dienelactone hydrolase
VAQVKAGMIVSPDYQVPLASVPSAWSHPVSPDKQADAQLPYITFVPAGDAPDAGWPVVVFGHGITRNKSDLFAIGPQLAAAGIASIAIDHVAHGDRAVRINTEGDCADLEGAPPDTSAQSECYAPFIASDLGVARDNARQSVLDQLKLIEVIKNCENDSCDGLSFDVDRIGYIGQSLGALIGITTISVSPDIKAAVLNVGGVGWVDVATFTQVPGFICPVIDRLIDAGILSGQKWNGVNEDALCLMPELWRDDPAFQSFANTGRWVYDPADGANFVDKLLAKNTNVLVQKVVGDPVVPNEATDQLGALLGLTAAPANVNRGSAAPTAPATAQANGWIDYESSEANDYSHGSLLAPSPGVAGQAATAQMQTDAITFLFVNL